MLAQLELRRRLIEHGQTSRELEQARLEASAEKARAEGVEIAREMVRQVRPLVQGVQLSAPFGRYSMAVEVAEAIGTR